MENPSFLLGRGHLLAADPGAPATTAETPRTREFSSHKGAQNLKQQTEIPCDLKQAQVTSLKPLSKKFMSPNPTLVELVSKLACNGKSRWTSGVDGGSGGSLSSSSPRRTPALAHPASFSSPTSQSPERKQKPLEKNGQEADLGNGSQLKSRGVQTRNGFLREEDGVDVIGMFNQAADSPFQEEPNWNNEEEAGQFLFASERNVELVCRNLILAIVQK
ncbi:hypothetical protein E5288_WYG022073 [Bos mutus]|uniref:Uncharacterized protein n=1 Tax=Bos mutus TaxID=72004 RepID=A0A6B0RV31_9CETA|nr:hypothetical protein [Bos mutus]